VLSLLLRRLAVAVAACAALPAAALAQGDARRSAAGSSRPYIAAGAELDWITLRAPTAGEQMGAIAAGEIDRVRAAARGGEVEPQVPLEGAPPTRSPRTGWQSAPLAGAARGRAPLGVRGADGRCDCATAVGDAAAQRIAALYAQATFTVGDELTRVRLLHLRMRYTDGVVAYVNGREVARRSVARDAGAMALAQRASGPEWESFYIPAAGLLRRGENRLAIEVRPASTARSPSLDVELEARSGARIVRGPIVQWSGPSAAVISFDTDLPATASIEYAVGGAAARAVRSAAGALAVHHRVELRSLPADSPVRYRVLSGGDATPERVFHTAPARGDVIRFAVYGDTRGGHAVHASIIESLLTEAPDFVVVTGDMVLRGSNEGDWQRFFQVAGELLARVPMYPAVGNHDMGRTGDEQRDMAEIFGLPVARDRPDWGHWYSFDVAGLHFAMLDSNAYGSEEQLAWLRDDLSAARRAGARAIFAAVHDGPYSRGSHGGNPTARERYAPILAEHGVVLLFSGHDHLYQRGEIGGLRYIVTGGGGAPLYPVRCGERGKPRCSVDDGAAIAISEHHYVIVTVQRDYVQACARRPDRTPLEKCVRYRLGRR
jgi:acid phosphatase type 7